MLRQQLCACHPIGRKPQSTEPQAHLNRAAQASSSWAAATGCQQQCTLSMRLGTGQCQAARQVLPPTQPPSPHLGGGRTLSGGQTLVATVAKLGAQARLVRLGHQLLAGHQASVEATCWALHDGCGEV